MARAHRKSEALLTMISSRNVVKWSEKDGINRQDHQNYLTSFTETFYNSVIALIEKAVKAEVSLSQDDLYIEVDFVCIVCCLLYSMLHKKYQSI